MSTSYDEMMGDPMDPSSHSAHNMPQATEHYSGDVVADSTPTPIAANDNKGGYLNLANQAAKLRQMLNNIPATGPKVVK